MGVIFLFNVTHLIPEIAPKYQMANSQIDEVASSLCSVRCTYLNIAS